MAFKPRNWSIFFFNTIFVMVPFEGHSGIFIATVFLFYFFAFLELLGQKTRFFDLERLRSSWKIFFFALIALFILPLLLAYREYDAVEYWRHQRQWLILLGFPLLFFMGYSINLKKDKTLWFMIVGLVLSLVIRVAEAKTFIIRDIFAIRHHTILSLQLEMCLVILYAHLSSKFSSMRKIGRVSMVFLFLAIMLMSLFNPVGRVGVITTACLVLIMLFDILCKFFSKILSFVIAAVAFAIMMNVVLKINQSFVSHINTINTGKEERLKIFECAVEINKKNLSLFGQGTSQTKWLTLKKWKEISLENGYRNNKLAYDFHNTYLQQTLILGFVGLVLSIIVQCYPFLLMKSPSYITLILPITLVFFIQSLTESILSSTWFVHFFVVYMSLAFFEKQDSGAGQRTPQ